MKIGVSIKKTIFVLAAMAFATPNVALSADIIADDALDCTCVTAASSSSVGKINLAKGEVLVSDFGGFSEASSGDTLVSGSQLNVGPGGSANISVGGSCNLNIASNSSVSITSAGSGQLCVQISSLGLGNAGPAVASGAGGGGVAGGAVLLGLGAAAGVALLLSDDDDPAPASN